MSGRNWELARRRNLMRNGIECVADEYPPALQPMWKSKRRKRRLTKQQLRDQAAAAVANFKGTITRVPARRAKP